MTTPETEMMVCMKEPELTCPACDQGLDISGPAVAFYRRDDLAGAEQPYWIPFIEDIRATPDRLIHAECYAAEHDLASLLVLITEHDQDMRATQTKLRQQLWSQPQKHNPGPARPPHHS